jgi:hypothetical protein
MMTLKQHLAGIADHLSALCVAIYNNSNGNAYCSIVASTFISDVASISHMVPMLQIISELEMKKVVRSYQWLFV